MNRRGYLRTLGAGLVGASLGRTGGLDSVIDVSTESEEPVSLADVIVPKSVFHKNLEEAEFYSGLTTDLKHQIRRDDELIPLYTFRRTLGFLELPSSPVEIKTRVVQLPSGESDSYPEELDKVFDWAISSRASGDRLSSERLADRMRVTLRKLDENGSADTATDVRGHNKRQIVDGVRQYEQWTRQPLEMPRDYMDDGGSIPADAFWENASIVELTDWGAFEVTIALDQPREEAQALQMVRAVAELQRRIVRSSPDPQPQFRE